MTHSPNLFPLKVLVISLGILLVGGFIFVMVTLTTKIHQDVQAASCPDASSIHLDNQGTLLNVTPLGSTVALTVKIKEEIKVLTVDRCTGNLLHTFTVTP